MQVSSSLAASSNAKDIKQGIMGKVMYKVGLGSKIERKEVNRSTEKTVWFTVQYGSGRVREDKELRNSSYHKWFDTFDQAKEYIVNKIENKIRYTERAITTYKDDLSKVKGLTEKDIRHA